MERFILYAAINGFVVVAFGAFGAHGLEGILTEASLGTWNTAVLYQMFHVVALILAALLCHLFPASKSFSRSGYLFQTGIVLFSGSLYLLALTGISLFAYITPLGGVAFLFGWGLIVYGIVRSRSKS
ncbi:MAG: hypothetical protein COA71_00830 [SAR86 cluster bacterium]|uniref:DUF423 domain-containing protein n=1 Tax=SAR86 cluster bacterium TaxID=2030880 RepID=A0A2A5CKF5_9GAMM|nr:DUF423 domain-containing protein [Gammaproteobacteria bacterium AH-315-E17]PCJ43846.1 MAG: hypothetical protein COA71_00830 [SAR86 cluster bacterium]